MRSSCPIPPTSNVLRLTYEGHEFLDAARSDTLWNQGKRAVMQDTGVLTLEGLKICLLSYGTR